MLKLFTYRLACYKSNTLTDAIVDFHEFGFMILVFFFFFFFFLGGSVGKGWKLHHIAWCILYMYTVQNILAEAAALNTRSNIQQQHLSLHLKPMYSFGKWWKWKFSLMGFVYRVVWVLKALWIILSETIHILRKLHLIFFFGMPPKILP